MHDSNSTVQEVLETAKGFRFLRPKNVRMCIGPRGKMCK